MKPDERRRTRAARVVDETKLPLGMWTFRPTAEEMPGLAGLRQRRSIDAVR